MSLSMSTAQQQDEMLKSLSEKRELQQKLADAQLESLQLKQKQLNLLEAKLAALVAMERDAGNNVNLDEEGEEEEGGNLSLIEEEEEELKEEKELVAEQNENLNHRLAMALGNFIQGGNNNNQALEKQESSQTLIEAGASSSSERSLAVEKSDMLTEMLNNPDFVDKITELSRQAAELQELEVQLQSLRKLKADMLEKDALIKSLSRDQLEIIKEEEEKEAEGDDLEEKVKAVISQFERDVTDEEILGDIETTIPQSLSSFDAAKEANLGELEAATEAMEKYLDMQEARRERGGETSDQEFQDQTIIMESLMQRLVDASTFDGEEEEEEEAQNNKFGIPSGQTLVVEAAPSFATLQKETQVDSVASAEKKISFREELEGLDDDEDDEDAVQTVGEAEMEETYVKISETIEFITGQLDSVKQAKSLIKNEEERAYFYSVVGKLTSQLEELEVLREKVGYYRELIALQKNVDEEKGEEEEEEIEETIEIEQEEEEAKEEKVLSAAPTSTTKISPAVVTADTPVVESQIAYEVENTEVVPETEVYLEKTSTSTMTPQQDVFIPSTSDYIPLSGTENDGESEFRQSGRYYSINNPKFFNNYRYPATSTAATTAGSSSRVNNSPVPSTVTSRKSSSFRRSMKLFEDKKDAIYQSAAGLIAAFEDKPHFLLTLFKQVSILAGNEASQQELLLSLDELIKEQYEAYEEDEEEAYLNDGENFEDDDLEGGSEEAEAVIRSANKLEDERRYQTYRDSFNKQSSV